MSKASRLAWFRRSYKKINLGKDTSGRPLVLNQRTLDMFRAVEAIVQADLTIVQGSYRAGGGAAASADTHDRGGVLDVRVWDLPSKGLTIPEVVEAFRRVGFAAWHRDKSHGSMDPHIHAVAIGDRRLSKGAAQQVEAFKARKNGLANGGPDYDPWVGVHTWEKVKKRAKKANYYWWRRYKKAQAAGV